jgi:hypothetical protein
MRLQLLVRRVASPIEKVLHKLGVVVADLEAEAKLQKGNADHLDIHAM